MDFYQRLSAYYDEIFAVDEGEMRFVKACLSGLTRLLDIGCGTGNKTVLLTEAGRDITGIDQDAAMIELARQRHAGPGLSYEVLDMLDIGRAFRPGQFDGALCLGNTLVHLQSPAAIGGFLAMTRKLLAGGYRCVIQILNYDRILDRKISELPPLSTPRADFARSYKKQGELLLFETNLKIRESGQSIKNAIPLYPLRRAELEALLRQAGFGRADYYGSYQGAAHEPDSFVTIAVCGN